MITLEIHKTLAKKLLQIEELYYEVGKILSHNYINNHEILRTFRQDSKTMLTNKTRCLLDDEFHRFINDREFKKLGHIYYNRAE